MIPHKPFKIAWISSNPNSFGLYGHILVAQDGESWQVGRTRSGGFPAPWEQGQIVEVPLKDDPVRHITCPAWEDPGELVMAGQGVVTHASRGDGVAVASALASGCRWRKLTAA